MPSFLTMFTLGSLTAQTTMSIIISWLTLGCKLQPVHDELQEITVTKLLYLHDPQACGRVYFYNYTEQLKDALSVSTIHWPVKNHIATAFRKKVKLWFALHVVWFAFGVAYLAQGHRSCGFYATLLPFCMTGIALLVVDILYTALFLADTGWTHTERDILNYIHNDPNHLFSINRTDFSKPFTKLIVEPQVVDDTSWISLLMAYCSCRGVVLWVLNFWTIQDNYFDGLKSYRHWQLDKVVRKLGSEGSEDSHV